MNITVLRCGLEIAGIVLTKSHLLDIESYSKGREILGTIRKMDQVEPFDPNKTSHIIKNIRFSNIVNGLEATVDFLPLPFGEQLNLIAHHAPSRIIWTPNILNMLPKGFHLISVDAIIKGV